MKPTQPSDAQPGQGGGNHHDHHGHDHSHTPSVTADNERRLRLVLILTASYAVVQATGGWIAGSLALIADSGHMVSDAAALLLALVAYRMARRAPDARRTYGFHRVRVLAALANGAALLLLVAWIAWEAVLRFRAPTEILAGWMLAVATVGLLVNLAGFALLHGGGKSDANLRGAYLHVLGDLLGSVGAIGAALGIMATGWNWLDPVLSLLVAVLVLRSAWALVTDALGVLMQTAPPGVDAAEIEAGIATLPAVDEAGHFHAWVLTDESSVATVHVTPAAGVDPLTLPDIVAGWLHDNYHIHHVTVQVDPPGCLAGICR